MIHTQTCVTVACDVCKANVDFGDHIPHFSDPQEADRLIEEIEWWSDGTVHICEDCRDKPHAYIPEVPGRDDVACSRCRLDAEGHETGPAEVA